MERRYSTFLTYRAKVVLHFSLISKTDFIRSPIRRCLVINHHILLENWPCALVSWAYRSLSRWLKPCPSRCASIIILLVSTGWLTLTSAAFPALSPVHRVDPIVMSLFLQVPHVSDGTHFQRRFAFHSIPVRFIKSFRVQSVLIIIEQVTWWLFFASLSSPLLRFLLRGKLNSFSCLLLCLCSGKGTLTHEHFRVGLLRPDSFLELFLVDLLVSI